MSPPRNDSRAGAGRRPEVLRTLKEVGRPLSIAEIAGRLGVHPNTVRFHLHSLVEGGQVEQVTSDRRVPGRPAQLFQAVRRMDPAGPREYRLLAEVVIDTLAADPDPRARAIEAGRAWGRRQGASSEGGSRAGNRPPVDRLVSLLDELGFAPQRDEATGPDSGRPPQVGLRNCPFLELATSTPHITCSIHLGLMQGALDAWDAPVTVERLEAFAEPDRCVAHLAAANGQS